MVIANATNAANSAHALALAAAGPVEPEWLRVAGQIAGTMLMIELLIALLIFAALMFGLAYGAWWMSRNVVPVIGQYSEQAQQYISIAERGSDRVAQGVAAFYGARVGIAAGFKAFFMPARRQRPVAPTPPPAAPQP
ncbi:MAG TPA: hypothetical protein VFQ25_14030 [Ktedonobacterales bacterium]|nr:hypothetical protein [Ktedonobacterales bacterium]